MKKIRFVILIITIILVIAILAGIAIQIFSPRSMPDPTYEIIAFLITGASVIIALLSQISSYRERREYSRIIHELNEVIADTEAEMAIDKAAYKKLEELIALDRRIYGRIAKKPTKKAKS